LALYTGRVFTLLEETRLIYDQHGITLAELFNDIVAKDVASCQPFLRSTEPSKPFR